MKDPYLMSEILSGEKAGKRKPGQGPGRDKGGVGGWAGSHGLFL